MRTMRSSRGVSDASARVVVSRRFDWIAVPRQLLSLPKIISGVAMMQSRQDWRRDDGSRESNVTIVWIAETFREEHRAAEGYDPAVGFLHT